MKKILFIELCNYKDYPTGGHLSFALHMLGAFGNELKLVGINTDQDCEVGKWGKRNIDRKEYDFFSVANVKKSVKKTLIPGRVTAYFQLKKHIKKIFETEYDRVLIQTPEVLFAIPKKHLPKTCLIMPGVENPLLISRYRFARLFACIYDYFFFRKAQYVSVILAAADNNALASFVERSDGKINADKARQFPTRYDADIFKIMNRSALRNKYDISKDTILYVTTGRLNWFKGWKFMIDCIERLNNPYVKLIFIGDGEDEEKIKNYIADCKLEKQIVLIGRKSMDVIAEYLNMADAFIMGSYKEGWSTSLVEAVACGSPCVVTEFSSAEDMIEDGVNGWVIKDRNEEEFTQRLKDVLKIDKSGVLKKAKEVSALSVQNMREQFLSNTGWK